MKKGLQTLFLSLCVFVAFAQQGNDNLKQSLFSAEQFPVFSDCQNLQSKALENCFYYQVQSFVFQNFVVPENLVQNNFH